jgi:HD-GYP domain-containing protein (c-di-GMP phosphodiesterase class II)
MREDKQEEYDNITILLKSKEWTHFVSFLKKQARAFQNKVNQHVEEGNIERAKIAKALMNDREKIIRSFIKEHNKFIGD